MQIERFIEQLAGIRMPSVFNPYSERCILADRKNGPEIRCANLLAYMRAAQGRVRSIWFGRDLGYRGGRRTGLALTDELHLQLLGERFGAKPVNRATVGPAMVERTATVVWSLISQLDAPPFLWNVFPFHPYEQDEPLSNRCHTAAERKQCQQVAVDLLDWLKPQTVVAIGNDAHKALTLLGIECHYVRHPSYGGQSEFIQGITRLYRGDQAALA